MTRIPLFLFIIILGFGLLCCSDRQENQQKIKTNETNHTKSTISDSDSLENIKIENIQFDFSAKQIKSKKNIYVPDGTIEINATLLNNNKDTTYFLSSSGNGDQYCLKYDTSNFNLTPLIVGNASFPVVQRIAPKGHYNFQAHFNSHNNQTKIKLGFDFYLVDKSFDINNKHLTIIKRPQNKQTILWAVEKTIK
jgi:hypothetical protein